MYKEGGAFIITSRILVVDLLMGVVSPETVHGLVVCHAHRCTDQSSEAFIIRLFKQGNRHGFIKAFSDDPESLSRGFTKLVSVNLGVLLWRVFTSLIRHATSRRNLLLKHFTSRNFTSIPGFEPRSRRR